MDQKTQPNIDKMSTRINTSVNADSDYKLALPSKLSEGRDKFTKSTMVLAHDPSEELKDADFDKQFKFILKSIFSASNSHDETAQAMIKDIQKVNPQVSDGSEETANTFLGPKYREQMKEIFNRYYLKLIIGKDNLPKVKEYDEMFGLDQIINGERIDLNILEPKNKKVFKWFMNEFGNRYNLITMNSLYNVVHTEHLCSDDKQQYLELIDDLNDEETGIQKYCGKMPGKWGTFLQLPKHTSMWSCCYRRFDDSPKHILEFVETEPLIVKGAGWWYTRLIDRKLKQYSGKTVEPFKHFQEVEFSMNNPQCELVRSPALIGKSIDNQTTFTFLKNLMSEEPTAQITLLKSDAVKYCVEYLWQEYSTKSFIFLQLPYIAQTITLSTIAINGYNKNLIIGALVYHSILFFYELAQLWVDKWQYFLQIKNVLDMVTQVCFIIFAARFLSGEVNINKPNEIFFLISLIFGINRGAITFFNLFPKTRYLVKMAMAVIADLWPFLVVLCGQLLIFAIIFIQLERDGEEFVSDGESYVKLFYLMNSFMRTWEFMMGTGEGYTFKTYVGSVLMVIATIFTNISMLNLVISVVGDTYERVNMTKNEEEIQVKAELLQDLSEFMRIFAPQSKDINVIGHVYILRLKRGSDDTDEWTGKINQTNNMISSSKKDILEKFDERFQEVEGKISGMQSDIKEIKELLLQKQ